MTLAFKRVFILLNVATAAFGFSQAKLIVRLKPLVVPTSIAAVYQIEYRDSAPGGPFHLFVVPPGKNKALIESQMRMDPQIDWVEDDSGLSMPEEVGGGKGSTTAVVNDRNSAYSLNTRALSQIGFSQSFVLEPGRPMRIAVLDTGLAPSCSLLWAKVIGQYNAVDAPSAAYDRPRGTDSNGNGIADEGVGHGTFVAGVIDQMTPQSQLVIVRVADSDGRATAWNLIKGISYAAAARAEVVNISLGSATAIPAMNDVLEWGVAKGLFFVGAAGNDNLEMVSHPSLSNKVFSVTGINHVNRKAPFANFHQKIEACAPSTGILSYGANGNLTVWSGTSFAAPFVAGAIAECLRHRNARVNPSALFSRIEGYGMSMDAANPAYVGKLGRKVWIPTLWSRIQSMP